MQEVGCHDNSKVKQQINHYRCQDATAGSECGVGLAEFLHRASGIQMIGQKVKQEHQVELHQIVETNGFRRSAIIFLDFSHFLL